MYIDYLCNHSKHIETVVNWVYDEFVIESEMSRKKFEQIKEHFNNTSLTSLPITLIAIDGNECLGTISIFKNDLKNGNTLTPWLASLYVDPSYRGQGIAERLICKVQEVVQDLGFEVLYLRTEHTSGYYKGLGWTYVYKTHDEKGQETEVFKIRL